MLTRARGAMLLDVLIGMGMLALLAVLAGRFMWGGFEIVRAQTRSAEGLGQLRHALTLLATDIPAAQKARCSGKAVAVTAADGREIVYEDTSAGVTRRATGDQVERWPLLRAEFGLSGAGLVDIRLTVAGSGDRPGTVCESAIWARALQRP